MQDPLLQGYEQGKLDVDKELLMSFFYKDNREKEGSEMPMSLRKMNIQELMRRLNTSRHGGISTNNQELKRRRKKYGNNLIVPDYTYKDQIGNDYVDVNLSREKSIFTYLVESCHEKIYLVISSIVLLIIAILEDINKYGISNDKNWIVGVNVLLMCIFIIVINILVKRYKHNSLLKMLRSMEEKIEATVIRDGKEFLIKQHELLVGDIVILSGGDSVPADCLVIEANLQAEVDESYLTPDINPVQKKPVTTFDETIDKFKEESKGSEAGESFDTPDPFLLASTLVVSGRMKALVWAVGNNTFVRNQNLHSPYYSIMGEKRTVLHSKIDRIIGTVGKYSFILCVLIFVGMTARLVHTRIANRQNNMEMNNLDIFGAISYLFTYFFILIVMLVPISLSKGVDYMINYTIKWLVSENVICLSKSAPENMARINQLCIEKGGTLTTK